MCSNHFIIIELDYPLLKTPYQERFGFYTTGTQNVVP
jgi:hypothetical protein